LFAESAPAMASTASFKAASKSTKQRAVWEAMHFEYARLSVLATSYACEHTEKTSSGRGAETEADVRATATDNEDIHMRLTETSERRRR